MTGRYGWAGGSTTAWRKVRAAVLTRDNHQCQLRLPGRWRTTRGAWAQCLGTANCVHHVAGRARTGDNPQWMVAACTPCNLRVGDVTKADPAPRPLTQW